MVWTIWLVETPTDHMATSEFNEKYGTVVEELNINSPSKHFSRYYYPIIMIRRIFYAGVLVLINEISIVQLALIEIGINFPVFFDYLVATLFYRFYYI